MLHSSPPPNFRHRRRIFLYATGALLVASSWAVSVQANLLEAFVTPAFAAGKEARSIDGTGNNPNNPNWGSTHIELLRKTSVDYADGVNTPSGENRASAREISNLVCAQTGLVPISANVSDFVWQWGQFIDHDIDLTEPAEPHEPFPIPVPLGDPHFDPFHTGIETIELNRSLNVPGTSPSNPREQINQITAFLDASMVYGSDNVRANTLRTLDGTGRLKTSAGNLLPFNVYGLPNAPDPLDSSMFLAGDVRANEQSGLTSLHTLFVREHNRLCQIFANNNPSWSGTRIYHTARAMVGGMIQVITYEEWLPVLLGPGALGPDTGYDINENPGIANVFSTASFRFGHSMLSPTLLRLNPFGQPIPEGHIELRDAFFNPSAIIDEGGIEPVLRGLAGQRPQAVDTKIIDDVRNFLFGPPGAGGFDLASLNIQRGRDHGLPGYNQLRQDLGLAPKASFAAITSDTALQAQLAQAYASPNEIDAWVGGLAEDTVPGALVGELVFTVLKRQFESLRAGDRFWYDRHLRGNFLQMVSRTRLADVVRRNTSIGSEIQPNVFRLSPGS